MVVSDREGFCVQGYGLPYASVSLKPPKRQTTTGVLFVMLSTFFIPILTLM